MSQINDALKRASQFQQQQEDTVRISIKLPSAAELKSQPPRRLTPAPKPQPSRDSTPAPKPQPSRDPAPASAPQSGRGLALPVAVILLIATAGVYIWLACFGRNLVSRVTTAAAVPPTVHVVVPPPVHAIAVPKPVSPPSTEQAVAVTVPAPMPLPIKVQGIYSYNGKWQAIVNNRTVYVGDAVDGFRVAAISRNNVSFIAPDGSKRTLGLGE